MVDEAQFEEHPLHRAVPILSRHNRVVVAFGEPPSPSHISNMVLPTANSGPLVLDVASEYSHWTELIYVNGGTR